MFDTLTYANKLKAAGFTEQQAKAQVEVLVAIVNEDLATKKDLELLRKDLELLRLEFKGQFTLLKWMLGVTIAGTLSLVLKTFFG